MIEDLDSVFEDSPYGRKRNSPSSAAHYRTSNGASVPSDLHLTLTPECPLGVSDSGKCLWYKAVTNSVLNTLCLYYKDQQIS